MDPMERKMKEAALFSEQGDDVDKLSLAQKHRANVTMGVKKYCVLDNCLKGRKLLLSVHELKNLPKEKRDALKAADYKVLTGYAAARDAALLLMVKRLSIISSILSKKLDGIQSQMDMQQMLFAQ